MINSLKEKKTLIDMVLFSKIANRQITRFKKIKEKFSTIEEYIVLHCIRSRSYKDLISSITDSSFIEDLDLFISNYLSDLKIKKNSGVSIHGISRDTGIPRTTVKRNTDNLIKKKLVIKNDEGYLVVTSLVTSYEKEIMETYISNYVDFSDSYVQLKLNR